MAGRPNNADDAPECYIVAWTTTPANVNLLTVAGSPGNCARGLMVGVQGTVVVTKRDGTNVTIPSSILTPGKYWRGQFQALTSGSTAQDVMVFW